MKILTTIGRNPEKPLRVEGSLNDLYGIKWIN